MTPKRRPKSDLKNPNFKNSQSNQQFPSPCSSSSQSHSSSTITSLFSQVEPPPNLLPSKSEYLKLFAVIAIAGIVAAGCSFLAGTLHRRSVPFCDTSVEPIDDSCEPCPSNGRCFKGQLECNQGYRKYGKACIEDGDINEIAFKLSEWAKDHLCEGHAQYICYGSGTIWVSENDLNSMLDNNALVRISIVDDTKYMYIKERALRYIIRLLNTRTTDDGFKEFKCPNSLAESYKPMTCRVWYWIAKHIFLLTPVCALLVGCTLLMLRIRRRWYLTNRAEQLYHQVCNILEDNALMAKSTSGREPWLVASRLRDHLLSPKERKDSLLWKMVVELVELDSRLDCYPKLVKGESKVVWEWQVEGSLRSSRKKEEEIGNHSSGADMNRSFDHK